MELFLRDDQYPFVATTHRRLIARGIVLDGLDRVAIHEVHRDDRFCKQVYFETPGGGVDEGETIELGLVRECSEELGYEVEILCKLGVVHDFYNLIGRENENHFFLARLVKPVGIHFASEGDTLIERTLYVPLEEAIALYEAQSDELVAGLVKHRELPMLREALSVLQG